MWIIYFKIYKKNILALKGNTTRTKPDIHNMDMVKVPLWILDKNRIVTLCIDIFFINNL